MSTIAGIGGERYWVHVPVNRKPRAYRDGGLVAAAAAVKGSPLANEYGDTELVHVNKYEMEKLREMWGEPGINPETGLPAYGWFGKLLGGIAKIAGTVLLTGTLGPVGAAMAVNAASGVVEGKSVGDILKSTALTGLTAGAGQVAGNVLPGAIGIGKDVAQAIGSGLGSTAVNLIQGASLGDALTGGVATGLGTYGANKMFDTVVDKNILGLGDAAKFLYGAGKDIAGGLGINDSISGIGKNLFSGGQDVGAGIGDIGADGTITVTGGKLNLPSSIDLYNPITGSFGTIKQPTSQPVEAVDENEILVSAPKLNLPDSMSLYDPITGTFSPPPKPATEEDGEDIVVTGQPEYGDITVIGAPGKIKLPEFKDPEIEQLKEDVDLPPPIEVIGRPIKDSVTIYPNLGIGIPNAGGGGGGGDVGSDVTIYPDNGGAISGGGGSSAPLTPIGGTYDTGPRTDIYGTRGLANITFDPFTYGQGVSQQPGEFLFFTQDGKPYGIVAGQTGAPATQKAASAMSAVPSISSGISAPPENYVDTLSPQWLNSWRDYASGTSDVMPERPAGYTLDEWNRRMSVARERGPVNAQQTYDYWNAVANDPAYATAIAQERAGIPTGINVFLPNGYVLVDNAVVPSSGADVPAMKDGGEAEDDYDGDDMVKHLIAWQKGGGHQGPGKVKGIGSGQEDKIPAWLSDGEYVWSAQDVSDLGDGSTDEGVRRLDKMRQMVRRRAGRKDVKKIAKPQHGIDTMLKAVGGPV